MNARPSRAVRLSSESVKRLVSIELHRSRAALISAMGRKLRLALMSGMGRKQTLAHALSGPAAMRAAGRRLPRPREANTGRSRRSSSAYLQYLRTEGAIEFRRTTAVEMQEVTHRGSSFSPPPMDLSDPAVAREMMSMFVTTRKHIADLAVCVIVNESSIELITSDDPAVLTNRVHIQRLKDNNFGLISSGAMLYLPLNPSRAILCYDKDAYELPARRNQFVNLSKDSDVAALNELEYLNARENLYFRDRGLLEQVRAGFWSAEPHRLSSRSRFWVGVKTGETATDEHYRRATVEEERSLIPKLITFSPICPSPSAWPSILRFRRKIRAMNNGSAAGYVRLAEGKRRGLDRKWEVAVPAVPDRDRSRTNPKTAVLRKR